MKFVDVKPMRLHCPTCNVTYKLPQNGHIKLYQEIKCPLDNFELVMWTTGAKGKVCVVLLYIKNRPMEKYHIIRFFKFYLRFDFYAYTTYTTCI